jgi:hypothetical protein
LRPFIPAITAHTIAAMMLAIANAKARLRPCCCSIRVRLLLRHTAAPLAALREYPLFGLTVASYTELQHWVGHLTSFDVEHGAVHQAHRSWAVTVTGPDLVRIQLQTDEGPSGEDE